MKIGLNTHTIAHRCLSASDVLLLAREHGLEGVQFDTPLAIEPELDSDRLEDFRRRADEMGLYVEVGVCSPNPVARSWRVGRYVSADEQARDLYRQIEAVAVLGCSHARTLLGHHADRTRNDISWADQVAASRAVLSQLTPALRELGVRLAFENHADQTIDELFELVEALGPEVAGVTLDTGNLVSCFEDALESTRRLAAWVLETHVKDGAFTLMPGGLKWQSCPVGSGFVPFPDLIDLVHKANPWANLSIQLRDESLELRVHEPGWREGFPLKCEPQAVDAAVASAAEYERRLASGGLADPRNGEKASWLGRDLEWLARSVGYLRPIVKLMDTL